MAKFLVGVDEVGRGPLAGPVTVGVVKVPANFNWKLLRGVNDSKKLTEKKREEIYRAALELRKKGEIDFIICSSSAAIIDRKGIVLALVNAQMRAFKSLDLKPSQCLVKLDGGLKAPAEFKFQETIIKGDTKEKVIGLASIVAKVTRDRYMVRISKKYPTYGFDIHKGYGTKKHREAVKKAGLCLLHRSSFCQSLHK